MSTLNYSDAQVQRTDRRRAAQIRQRKFERRVLQVVTILAAILLVILIIVSISGAGKGKKIAALNATVTQLEAEKADLQAQITELEASLSGKTGLPTVTGPVQGSFFDDALIVGDSLSVGLQQYAEAQRTADTDCLGKAQFYTAGGMSWSNLLFDLGSVDAVFPSFNGETMRLEEAVVSSGATKVYLMLGINDLKTDSVETVIDNVGRVIAAIREKAPDVAIIIQSVTPMTAEKQAEGFDVALVSQFDTALKTWCEANSSYYLNLVPTVTGEDGALNPNYCSDADDMGIHFNDDCNAAWVAYLLDHPYGQ